MSAWDTECDVAIVGAGPAGSAAAIALARAGRRVILLERKRFPRDKVCGGCLSGRAVAHLRALVGADQPPPGVPAEQISFTFGAYRLACRPQGATHIVLRSALDEWLADLAASAGAAVRFGQAASLVRGDRGWDVTIGDARLRASVILLACGLSALPAQVGIVGRAQRRRMVAQQWIEPATDRLPPLGGIEMHWLRGGYLGLATPARDQCVVALAAEVPAGGGENVWARLRRQNPDAALWSRVSADAPRRYAARGSAGFPWTPDRLATDNVLLIGDAAGYQEPFTGEGMAQALCSAACAARAVLMGGDIAHQYAAIMARHHRGSVQRLRWLGGVLRSRTVRLLASGPALVPRQALARLVAWVHVRSPAWELA